MAKVLKHRGWTIRITPWQDPAGLWSARLELYEPEDAPGIDSPIPLSFSRHVVSEPAAVAAALKRALEWIDRQCDERDPTRGLAP